MAQSPSLTPDEGLLGRLRSDRANALFMLSRLAGGKSAPQSADYYHGVVERSERALRQAGRPAFLFSSPGAQAPPAQGRVVDVPAHPLDHASRGIERQIAQRGGVQGPPDPRGTPLARPHSLILNSPGVKTPAPVAKGRVVNVANDPGLKAAQAMAADPIGWMSALQNAAKAATTRPSSDGDALVRDAVRRANGAASHGRALPPNPALANVPRDPYLRMGYGFTQEAFQRGVENPARGVDLASGGNVPFDVALRRFPGGRGPAGMRSTRTPSQIEQAGTNAVGSGADVGKTIGFKKGQTDAQTPRGLAQNSRLESHAFDPATGDPITPSFHVRKAVNDYAKGGAEALTRAGVPPWLSGLLAGGATSPLDLGADLQTAGDRYESLDHVLGGAANASGKAAAEMAAGPILHAIGKLAGPLVGPAAKGAVRALKGTKALGLVVKAASREDAAGALRRMGASPEAAERALQAVEASGEKVRWAGRGGARAGLPQAARGAATGAGSDPVVHTILGELGTEFGTSGYGARLSRAIDLLMKGGMTHDQAEHTIVRSWLDAPTRKALRDATGVTLDDPLGSFGAYKSPTMRAPAVSPSYAITARGEKGAVKGLGDEIGRLTQQHEMLTLRSATPAEIADPRVRKTVNVTFRGDAVGHDQHVALSHDLATDPRLVDRHGRPLFAGNTRTELPDGTTQVFANSYYSDLPPSEYTADVNQARSALNDVLRRHGFDTNVKIEQTVPTNYARAAKHPPSYLEDRLRGGAQGGRPGGRTSGRANEILARSLDRTLRRLGEEGSSPGGMGAFGTVGAATLATKGAGSSRGDGRRPGRSGLGSGLAATQASAAGTKNGRTRKGGSLR